MNLLIVDMENNTQLLQAVVLNVFLKDCKLLTDLVYGYNLPTVFC